MQNTYIIYKFLTMKILKISTITVAVLVAVFIIIACIFPPIAKNYINKPVSYTHLTLPTT